MFAYNGKIKKCFPVRNDFYEKTVFFALNYNLVEQKFFSFKATNRLC